MKKLAFLCSGNGTNAENLIKEVLNELPTDRISQKILEGLSQAKISGTGLEDLESIFNEAELLKFKHLKGKRPL